MATVVFTASSTTTTATAFRGSVNETFSTISAGSGTGTYTSNVGGALTASTTSNQFARLERSTMTFDTSSLPDNAIITSAKLVLFGRTRSGLLGSPDLHIVGSSRTSGATISNGDYSTTLNTSFGSFAYSSFALDATNDIVLNSSGISNISLTGNTTFGTKLSWDLSGTFGGSWNSNFSSALLFGGPTDTGNEPKLSVTYTLPVVEKTQAASAVVVQQGAGILYFNGKNGISDPGSKWTSDSNAFAGDFNTGFSAIGPVDETNSSKTSNYLQGLGTNATGSEIGAISQVRLRVMAGVNAVGFTINGTVYTGDLSQELGSASAVQAFPSPSFGSWVTLTAPAGGWTWSALSSLAIRFWSANASDTYAVSVRGGELEVTYVTTLQYSYGAYASLPSTNTVLANLYTPTDYTNVSTIDGVFVDAALTNTYGIHQFASFSSDNTASINPTWVGRLAKPASTSAVTMQIYNITDTVWETLATNATANAGDTITLTGSQVSNLSKYYDSNSFCYVRVYQ